MLQVAGNRVHRVDRILPHMGLRCIRQTDVLNRVISARCTLKLVFLKPKSGSSISALNYWILIERQYMFCSYFTQLHRLCGGF